MISAASKKELGFTLMEVVIAITILSFITMFTAESISRALKSKKKIETSMEANTMVRDALRVISEDVRKAFKYEDIHIGLYNLAQKERKKQYESAQKKGTQTKDKTSGTTTGTGTDTGKDASTTPSTSPNAQKKKEFPLKEDIVVTQFIGEKEELHFTSLNNIQAYEDAQISDQMEVSYLLEDCKNRIIKKKRSKCLWRRTSKVLDKDPKEGGSKSVLLENITEFSLRYLGVKEEPEWVDRWMSDGQGDDMTKGKFPFAVEITLEVHDKTNKKSKPVKMTYVAPLRFPAGVTVPKEESPPPQIGGDENGDKSKNKTKGSGSSSSGSSNGGLSA